MYDGGDATSPFNIYEVLDGNTSMITTGFSANEQYNFTNTVSFSNTVSLNGVRAAGSLGTNGQVLTTTGYSVEIGRAHV